MIIAGHGRVKAAKLLGLDQVPTIRLESLTPDQVRAYIIATTPAKPMAFEAVSIRPSNPGSPWGPGADIA
jgi:hypothetical protein